MPDATREFGACLLPNFAIRARDPGRRFAYRAGLALPVASAPIFDALVVTEGDRIVGLGEAAVLMPHFADATNIVEMPRAVLMPGLINAHCHLSLTFAGGLLAPSEDFVTWIRKLLPLRGTWTEREYTLSTLAGLRESLRGGCVALGDIVTEMDTWDTLAEADPPIRLRAYREFLGWSDEERERHLKEARAFAGESVATDGPFPGLSPHAPYSTPPALYDALIEVANAAGLPLSSHVAETRVEAEFLASGGGPFGEIHDQLGWRSEPRPWAAGEGLATWLAKRQIDVPLQIVHGTHLSDEDIAALADCDCSVVYCPGSVAYFHGGEDPHPVQRLLAAGIRVALGTDSLASSPTLNMPLTCTLSARAQAGLTPETILEMATRAGAESLGFDDGGMLHEGGRADFLLFDLAGGISDGEDPTERARAAIEGALLGGYRVPSLHVFAGRPYGFAALRPHPA